MRHGSALPDLDFGVGGELVRRDVHVLRRRPDAYPTRRVVLRAVARAEPAPILAFVVADPLPLRNATEMGADADHHEPGLALRRGAVGVGGGRVVRQVGVARQRIGQAVDLDAVSYTHL